MKRKFKSSEEKRKFEENERSWKQLQEKYKPNTKIVSSKRQPLSYSLTNPPGRDRQEIASKSTPGGSTAKKESNMYSGNLIKGIGMMHKSNFIPVIDDSLAKDIAHMRR